MWLCDIYISLFPIIIMEQETAVKATMVFLAIKSFVVGVLAILIAISLGAVLGSLSAIPGAGAATGSFGTVITIMWVLGIVEILLGIFAIVSAVVIKK